MGKGKVIFIKNAAILTATSLVLRMVGMMFRVWLATAIGAEGMGLYQQIFSVYVLISVFASSGVGLAVTRLVSEELTLGRRSGISLIIRRSMLLTLFVAVLSGFIVYFSANSISVYIISDNRAAEALRIMCFSLPFMAISAVLKGYFFARKKAAVNSVSQCIEQTVRVAFIFLWFTNIKADVASGCAAVLLGDAVAEFSSAFYLSLMYFFDKKRLPTESGRLRPPYKIMSSLIRIVSPIAGGRYLNSFLRTVENILVPMNLQRFGLSNEDALSGFGMIKGMALPLLLFPAGLLSSVTSLLVPEMSEAAAAGHKSRIKYAAERSIALTFIASIPFAVIFFFAAEPLSALIYSDAEVGNMVKLLAPLVPLMYIDSVSDALLKALDKQLVTFRHAVLDSLGRIALILAFLPRFGIGGFIAIMYVSNIFTSMLNLIKLIQVSGAKISVLKQIIIPLLTALIGGLVADTLLRIFNITGLVYIILITAGISVLYIPLFPTFECFKN